MEQDRKKTIGMIILIIISILLILLLFFFIYLRFKNTSSDSKTEITTTPTSKPASPDTTATVGLSITNISPEPFSYEADYTGKIIIEFNKTIRAEDFILLINPKIEGVLNNSSSQTLEFTPSKRFNPSTPYEAIISSRTQVFDGPDGKNASEYSWRFTTDSPSGEEAVSNTEAIEYLKIRQQSDQAYQDRLKEFPFLIHLPYETKDFKIEITTSDVIEITTLGSTPTQNLLFRKDALEWLEQNGGKIEDLNIVYK